MILHSDRAIALLVDFLNTAPGKGKPQDEFSTPQGVERFMADHLWESVGKVSAIDAIEAQDVRGRLAEAIFASTLELSSELLNKLLAEVDALPRLVNHDGLGWHLHYSDARATLRQRLAAQGAMTAAQLIVDGRRNILRSCAAMDCDQLFADFSKNQSKMYCDSRGCRSRVHVQAFRRRKKEVQPK